MSAVELTRLTKRFGGLVAVDDVSLGVDAGEVLGFLGPNGAGKSTTVRLLMGFLRPTSGSCRVLGVWPGADVSVRRWIGYLPGDFRIEPGMTGGDLVGWYARLRGAPAGPAWDLADRLELDLSRPFRTLSKGNRQKIGIVQAFFHRPEVLLLDEPSTGLDPLVQRELLALVREAARRGAAVVFSSHVLPEVERVAARIAVLRHGRLVALAPVHDLLDGAPQRLELSFAGPAPAGDLERVDGVVAVTPVAGDGTRLDLVVEGPVGPALAVAATRATLVRVAPVGDELEDLFFGDPSDETTREGASR
jgi:ABC-2 type transport system ATP-binding protein